MIRRLLLGICLFCALLLTLAALVLVLQDANEYKAEIETWLSTQVGSEVRIEGEINLSIYPWIGLRVEQVRIASPIAYGDEPLVSAAGAVIRTRLGPLMRDRDIVLDRLVLDRPVITLRRFADGRANWHHMLRRFGMIEEQQPPSFVQAPPGRHDTIAPDQRWTLKAERMHGVSIVGGRVQYIDDATNEYLVVDQLFLETGPGSEFEYELRFRVDESVSGLFGVATLEGLCVLNPAEPSLTTNGADFSFRGSARYAEEIVTGTVRGRLDLDTAASRMALQNATADLGFARADFSVESPLPLGQLPVTGDVQLNVLDAGILTRVWHEVIEGEDLRYVEGLSLRASYRVEQERVLLEGLHAKTAGMTAIGRGELLLGEAPRASILIEMPAVALEGLFDGGGEQPEWLATLLEKGALPDLGVLDALRIGIDAGAVQGYGLDLQRVSMDMDMGGDEMRFDMSAGEAFGGSVNGTVEIAADGTKATSSAEGIDLAALATVLRQNGVIAGDAPFPTGAATGSLHATAPTPGQLAAGGELEFSGSIRNGVFAAGAAVDATWSELEFTANRKAGGPGAAHGFTVQLSAVDARGRIAGDDPKEAMDWRTPELRLNLDGGISSGSAGDIELTSVKFMLKAAGKQGEWSLLGTRRLEEGLGKLNVSVGGAFNLNQENKRILVENLVARGFGLAITGQGVLDYGEAWSLVGTIGLPEFAPRVCMTHLGVTAPQMIEPGLLAACEVQAQVEAKPGWVRFHNINLHLDESTARGEFTYSRIQQGLPDWALSFDLRFDALDADRYLFGHPHPQTTQAPQKAEPWKLDWLKTIRSRGRLRIGELELFDLSYHNVDLTSELRDSVFTLEPFTAGFYNGKLRLGIRGEVRDTLAMTVDLELEKFDLLSVLEVLGDWDRMGGTTSIVMQLKSRGLSSAEHLLSLSGGGDVMVKNGFYAYNKETVKTEDEKMLWREFYENQREDSESAEEEQVVEEERVVIPVKTATATIQIRDGIFSNEDFIARGDRMTARGSGTMNIPLALLDYTILVDAKVIPVFPIHIKGALADPDVEEGGVGFVETLFTTFRNILTIPFSAMDALSRQARQLQEGQDGGQRSPGAEDQTAP